jgi:NAD(P)-dependent dehydrogenase (short-subunit alcohol dehydrogenase family)
MKKQCLILGGGSKFGRNLTENFVACDYQVRLVTGTPGPWHDSSSVQTVAVDWKTLAISDIRRIVKDLSAVDVIFFNQNSCALSFENFKTNKVQSPSSWQQNYFVACQLPFYLVQALRSNFHNTKVAWMLSSLIANPQDSQVGYADYIGNKFTNYCIMKSFSLSAGPNESFFAMHPDGIQDANDSANKAHNMVKFINNSDVSTLNGKIFSHTGTTMLLG